MPAKQMLTVYLISFIWMYEEGELAPTLKNNKLKH